QANLETRPEKHEPRSEAEQRAAWREQATAVLARDERCPEKMVASALGARWGRDRVRGGDASIVAGGRVGALPGHLRQRRGAGVRPQVVAARVLSVLEGSRATWQVWHVRAETLRQLRSAQVPLTRLEEHGRE